MGDGKLRALVATASLDLGIDWGNVDLVCQMGAPKGSSRLLQRIGRANHRLDEPSKGMIVPGNRFEYLEAQAALDAVDARELDPEIFRPGTLDVLAQHILAIACAGPFIEAELLAEVRSAAPYAGLDDDSWRTRPRISSRPAAMRLRAYDKFRRLVEETPGHWRITKPAVIAQHRLNAGIIVDNPMMDVRFKNGRMLGKVEEGFASTLTPGDHIFFAGLSLEIERFKDSDIIVHASSKPARIVTYGGQRMSMSTHLAERVRNYLASPDEWARFPDDVREWLEVQQRRSRLPQPDELLVETFPLEGRHYMVHVQLRRLERPPVARHADHQAHGNRRPQAARLRRQRLCHRRLRPRTDHRPRALALARHPRTGIRRVGRTVATAQARLSRGRGDRRAGRAPAPGQAQDRAPGQLLDRPHLRRAAQI